MFARLFDSPWSIVVIVLVVVIIFGWKRLPDAARSVGRSMRIFKSEVQQMTDKDDQPSAASQDTVRGESSAREHGAEQPQAETPESGDRDGEQQDGPAEPPSEPRNADDTNGSPRS